MELQRFLFIASYCLFCTHFGVVMGLYEPTGLACSSPDSTTLIFTWSRPAGGSGTVLGYHLSLERTDGVKTDVLPMVDTNNYYVETYTYSGLGKYAVYQFTIHSYTASGNDNDVILSCMTLEDIPDQGPSGVNATGISYSEIYVIWNELEAHYKNGILLGYKIIYFSYGSDTPHSINVSTNTLDYTITGLDFDTYYVVSVLAFTVIGDGPRVTNPDKTLGLETDAPEVVQKYYCYEVIPGTLEINWEGMPCTVYVGIISGLFTFMMIFLVACCCKCCGGDPPKGDASGLDLGGSGFGGIGGGMAGGIGVGGKSVGGKNKKMNKNAVKPYDDEGYYEDDEDGFPYHGENRGNITTRDIWIASPVPDRTFERPPPAPAKVPVINKMMGREASGVDLELGDNPDDPHTNFEDDFKNENENSDSGNPGNETTNQNDGQNNPNGSSSDNLPTTSNQDNQVQDANFF